MPQAVVAGRLLVPRCPPAAAGRLHPYAHPSLLPANPRSPHLPLVILYWIDHISGPIEGTPGLPSYSFHADHHWPLTKAQIIEVLPSILPCYYYTSN